MRDKRDKDWFWLENDIVDRIDLEPLERLLYMVLARHSNESTSESFPGEETLCLKSGIKDKRTIRKYIQNLENKGLVEVKREKGKSNRYYLKNAKLVTSDVTALNDTSNIPCSKPVTFDARTSSIECHSNKTHNKTNKIMNHKEHDFFENLFESLKVNFTTTNQKAVNKLLKTLSKEETEKYLLETYENMKSNPSIKNISGAFSKKIQTGERQPKYQIKIKQKQIEKQDSTVLESKTIAVITAPKILTQDLIIAEKEEKANLDILFNSFTKQKQENLMSEALKIAKIESNGFEAATKFLAKSVIKYRLLREIIKGVVANG
ncbi:helix-turn-helix domain-containing protein [Cetobacterium somerae]